MHHSIPDANPRLYFGVLQDALLLQSTEEGLGALVAKK